MKNMFEEHGQYNVTVTGNLIHVKLSGSFNLESAQGWSQKMREAIESLKGQRFFILLEAVNYEGATPEAYAISNELNEWINTQNLIAKAMVTTAKIHVRTAEHFETELQKQTIKTFKTVEQARVWLSSFKSD